MPNKPPLKTRAKNLRYYWMPARVKAAASEIGKVVKEDVTAPAKVVKEKLKQRTLAKKAKDLGSQAKAQRELKKIGVKIESRSRPRRSPRKSKSMPNRRAKRP